MKNTIAKRIANGLLASAIAAVAITAPSVAANAARLKVSTLNFDFNTAGNLANDFTTYVDTSYPGNLVQSPNGGIGDTGAIAADDSLRTYGVIEPNANYTMGPVGAKYVFSGYMKSIGGSGYSGFGFTTLDATANNVEQVNGSSFRPTDALGISVHGGGFIFHNGADDYSGSWSQSGDNGNIHTVTAYAGNGDLLDDQNPEVPDHWYKIIYSISKTSSTKFTSRVEVWPSSADGTLLNTTASAIFEVADQVNPVINNSSELASYINFSGYRVTRFDNFSTKVVGATITGAPAGSVTEEPDPSTGGETDGNTDGESLANTGASSDKALVLGLTALATIWAGISLVGIRRKESRN